MALGFDDSAPSARGPKADAMAGGVAEPTLLTVAEISAVLKVKQSWVYSHAAELGAYRLGKYLRFSMRRVVERLENGEVG